MRRVNTRQFWQSLSRVPNDQVHELVAAGAFKEVGTDQWSSHIELYDKEAVDAAIVAAQLGGSRGSMESLEAALAVAFAGVLKR